MSRQERAVLDAARRWAQAVEPAHEDAAARRGRHAAETALLQAVRSWFGGAGSAKAADEDYAEQAIERAVESTSGASTLDRAEATEQLTGSGERGRRG